MKVATSFALMLLAGACATDAIVASPVPASRETVGMGANGDAADDPAIWVHPTDPARSLILGTNKDVGVYVYGLDGSEKQRLPVGLSNNIDLRGNLAVRTADGELLYEADVGRGGQTGLWWTKRSGLGAWSDDVGWSVELP